jgi:hypothetical protein
MRLLEQGLWSAYPREFWDMELSVARHQGDDFHFISPDEPEARAAFIKANPQLVEERATFIASLTIVIDLLGPAEEDEECLDEEAGDDAGVCGDMGEEEAA